MAEPESRDAISVQSLAQRGVSLLTARTATIFVLLICTVSLFADMTYEGGRALPGNT